MPIFPLLLATQLYEYAGANGLPAAEAEFFSQLVYIVPECMCNETTLEQPK